MSEPTLKILEDILYNASHDRANYKDPELVIALLGVLPTHFQLSCPYFRVSPHQWEVIYDIAPYRAISGRTIQKVRGYKPYWIVEVQAAGYTYYQALANIFGDLRYIKDDFTPVNKIYFRPPGDDTRPMVEVIITPGNELKVDYFANKYRGYTLKFRIEGVHIYPKPILPRWDSTEWVNIPSVLGSAGCGWE